MKRKPKWKDGLKNTSASHTAISTRSCGSKLNPHSCFSYPPLPTPHPLLCMPSPLFVQNNRASKSGCVQMNLMWHILHGTLMHLLFMQFLANIPQFVLTTNSKSQSFLSYILPDTGLLSDTSTHVHVVCVCPISLVI